MNERINNRERDIAQTKGENMPWIEESDELDSLHLRFRKGILEIVFPRGATSQVISK